MGTCSEVSMSHVINFNFKKEFEQNPNLKAIAEKFIVLIPDSEAKVALVVQNIDRLLSTVDHKELDQGIVSLKIVLDDLDSGLLKMTMNLIRIQQDRISDQRVLIEWQRRVYSVSIMIAIMIMLVVSSGLAIAGERPAAYVTATLAAAIKATETYLINVKLTEKERMLEGDEEVIKMMRDGELLMVHEFKNVQQKANTLNKEIKAERSKLKEHSERMEKSEMNGTIKKIKYKLKDLKSIVNGYSNQVREFSLKFTNMVRN